MSEFQPWAVANLPLLLLILAGVTLVAVALALYLALRLRSLERHYAILTRGTNGGDLAVVMEAHAEAVRATGTRVQELDGLVRSGERRSRTHLQRWGFVRFNPFRDAGGDQSFALTLADRDGNGVVISSLHGRDGTRIYGKPLSGWSSVYPLTDEERQVIQNAKAPGPAE